MFNKIGLRLAVTFLIMLAMSVPVSALVVRSSVNGIEVESGGFEAETVGEAPSNASVGSYGSTVGVTVTDAPAENISDSLDGVKFVKNTGGVFNAVMSGVTSGTIHAEFSAYIPEQSSGNGNTMLILTGNGGYPGRFGAWVGFSNPANWTYTSHSLEAGQAGIFNHDGVWHNTTTDNGTMHMTAPYDKWFDISVDLDVDNKRYTITVNGITSDPMDFTTGGSTAINVFEIRENVGNYDGCFYLDSAGDQKYHTLEIQVNEPEVSSLVSPSEGIAYYSEGSSVELKAIARHVDLERKREYIFDHWEINGITDDNHDITIAIDRDTIARAFYSVIDIATSELEVKTNYACMEAFVTPSVGTHIYLKGDSVELEALSSHYDNESFLEYEFDHWQVNGDSFFDSSIVITADSNTVAEAVYVVKEPSVTLTGKWELFIDDFAVSTTENVTRTMHQPVKNPGGPVIRPDKPWDISPYYNSVLYDEEESVYKMWYMSYNYGLPLPDRTPILYATSTDGINWEKPNLGLYSFNGSTDNNIVLTCYGYHDLYSPSVVKDSLETDPERRYKMIYWDYPGGPATYGDAGMCVAFSSDGVHWVKHSNNPVLYAQKTEESISDVMDVMYDSNSGKFFVYAKGWADPWPSYRLIVHSESDDFIRWTKPHPVIRHAFDDSDPQSYGMPVSQYETVYLGLLRSYKLPGDMTIDVQLTISHDNELWSRVGGMATFIPVGEEGSWDDGMIFTSSLVVRDDTIEIFYGGWDGPHDSRNRRAQISVARLRKDGFISLDAGSSPGSVTTRKLQGVCGGLFVNADAEGGWLKAEVLDAAGNVLPGYSLDDCLPVTGDDVNINVQWRNKNELPRSDEDLRLRFVIQNASLYSFLAGKYSESGGRCGDYCHPQPEGDLGGPFGVGDCLVSLYDFAIIAKEWLGAYDFSNLSDISENWLYDTRP